jgi:hypothetical protein
MLVPRFTIRTILAVTTGLALVFVMLGTALRGHNWGWGVAIGVLSLAVTALVHAGCFGLVWMYAQMSSPPPPARDTRAESNREENTA